MDVSVSSTSEPRALECQVSLQGLRDLQPQRSGLEHAPALQSVEFPSPALPGVSEGRALSLPTKPASAVRGKPLLVHSIRADIGSLIIEKFWSGAHQQV